MVLGVVVANRSGDHPTRTRTWRAIRLRRSSASFAAASATAVAVENKPTPDNPSPTRIFSGPITIIALWMSHEPNMTLATRQVPGSASEVSSAL